MDFTALMQPHLRNVKPYIPGKPVEELRRERNLEGEIIKLASNENPYPPLDIIQQAIIQELNAVNRYPNSGCHYLTTELAEYYGLRQNQVFVGNGSNEILDLLVRAFVNPGEEVVYPFPSFIAYPLVVQLAGVKEVKVPLKNYCLDLQAMREAITQNTKMVFICNPNNPTATYVPEKDVELFLEGIRKDIIVVFDEAYYEYVTAPDYPDSIRILRERDNIIILRTFSKVFSLSGLRVGYSLSHENLVTCLHMVRQPFNVNRVAQIAARAALANIDQLRDRIDENNRERETLTAKLRDLGFVVPPSQTNFLLVLPRGNKKNIVHNLMDLGIIVRGMSPFGLGEESFRLSVGTPEENRVFLDKLKSVL
ncbi:MAG: histidinol-phosphate transaminase [Candidatus Krumholzibacteriota bacterium]|nr:histidinol-phosphate transaminase [Candidatus Krumholzibacteriota bacterium]